MIRSIVIDDEPLALDIIEEYLSKIAGLTLLAKMTDSSEALAFLEKETVDLIFLDIEMPGLDGIDFARQVRGQCSVIMTTAYPQYALDGFELNAADYLLKPFTFERFERAVQKVIKERSPNDYLYVKTDQRVKKVPLNAIRYVEGMKDYVSIYTDDERIISLQVMKKLNELLPEELFIRIHRSYIVAVNHITEWEKNRIWIGDVVIPIGETYREAFFRKTLERRI